jgi:hypothetical protein
MAPNKPLKTGGQAGGRAGRPSGPIAGTKDKTARVPSSWNARSVDPTNQRGAGQRTTGGMAGGRAGKPAGKIAGQTPKPAAKPSGMTMSGDRQAAIKGANNPAGPRAPKPAWGPVPTATEARNARNAANRTAKGYGQPGKVEAGLRQAAGMVMTAARIARGVTPGGVAYEILKPRSLANEPNANITRFANARNRAFAKAKGIKGSPVLGGKKSVAASFDSAFAAARKAGKSGFTFKGKKYTTKMK